MQTEHDALSQFSSLQAVMPGISPIPERLREAIRWAEMAKSKRRTN